MVMSKASSGAGPPRRRILTERFGHLDLAIPPRYVKRLTERFGQ
jgi:hypothetical protein